MYLPYLLKCSCPKCRIILDDKFWKIIEYNYPKYDIIRSRVAE